MAGCQRGQQPKTWTVETASVSGPYVPADTKTLGEARSEFFKPGTTDMQLPIVTSSNPSRAAGENPTRRMFLF